MLPIRESLDETSPMPEGWVNLATAKEMTGRSPTMILNGIRESKFPALKGYFGETVQQVWRIEPEGLMRWSRNR